MTKTSPLSLVRLFAAAAVTVGLSATAMLPTSAAGPPSACRPPRLDPARPIPHPDGHRLVLSSSRVGGWVPTVASLLGVPDAGVYGDGTVIVVDEPPHTTPGRQARVRVAHIPECQLQDLLRLAGALGLPKVAPAVGRVGITDQATTTVTVDADHTHRSVRVYALDFDSPGPTAAEQSNRAQLRSLVTAMSHAADGVPAGELPAWVPRHRPAA